MTAKSDLERVREQLLQRAMQDGAVAQAVAAFTFAQRVVPQPAPTTTVMGVRYSTAS